MKAVTDNRLTTLIVGIMSLLRPRAWSSTTGYGDPRGPGIAACSTSRRLIFLSRQNTLPTVSDVFYETPIKRGDLTLCGWFEVPPVWVAIIGNFAPDAPDTTVPNATGLGIEAGSSHNAWFEFGAEARHIQGDRQTIGQGRLGLEAELLGGTTRISDRDSDLTRSRRAVICLEPGSI
jgi:hypothetical protein